MKKILLLLSLAMGSITLSNAQITMSATTINMGCTNSTTYYETGGAGNYANNVNVTQTFTTNNAAFPVGISFTSFSIESGWDYLYIYNGPSTASPLLGTYTGTALPPSFTSTDPSGALTFRFTTDASVVTSGWIATITGGTGSPVLSTLTTNETCDYSNNGTINLTSSTNNPPYSFAWSNGATSEDLTSLAAGTYSVTVTGGSGCTSTTSATITEPTAISVSPNSITDVTCGNGNDGAASINTPSGGTGALTIDWTPGAPAGDGTESISTLIAGNYTATVTDASGCSASTVLTVNQPAVNYTAQSFAICNGDTVYVGASAYTTAGVFNDTLVAANGCDSIMETTITFKTIPTLASLTASSTTICEGENSTLTAVATVPAPVYCVPSTSCSFPDVITDVNFGSIANSSGLGCNGGYNNISPTATTTTTVAAGVGTSLTVITGGDAEGAAVWIDYDQNGTFEPTELVLNGYTGSNPATYSTTVTIPATALNGNTIMRVRCRYAQDASLSGPCANYTFGETEDYTITITGATEGMLYDWTQNSTYLNVTDSSVVEAMNALTTELYIVNATYQPSGCSVSDSIEVVVNTLPVVDLGADFTACDSTVTIDAGNVGSTYNWNDGSTSQTFTTSTSGQYFVDVVNAQGCTSSDTINLTLNTSSVSTLTESSCGDFVLNGQTYTTTGIYSQTLVNSVGCDSIITLDLTVNAVPTMSATDNGDLSLTASNAASYQWINCISGMAIAGETNQTLTVSQNGEYAVVGTNAQGCSDTSACVLIDYVALEATSLVDLSIAPNPTNDMVTVKFNATEGVLIIRDAQGKLIQRSSISSGTQVSLVDLNTGVYFFELSTPSGTKIERVVKN